MSRKVTYAAYGFIDWVARIPIGMARMTVKFTGGALTKYGTTPAEFTTSDPFTQQAIENSDYYRSGKIKTLRASGKHEIRHPSRQAHKSAESTLPIEMPQDDHDSRQQEMTLTLDEATYMLNSRYHEPLVMIRTADAAIAAAGRHNIRLKIKPG